MELQESIKGLTTTITGEKNYLEQGENIRYINTEIRVSGMNNKVIIGNNAHLERLLIHIKGSNHTVYIGEDTRIVGHILIKGKKENITIGDRTTFQDVYLLAWEGKSITIGNDCMFSHDVVIRTTDSHSVIDVNTNERLNKSGDVVIGDHVWLSSGAFISKGAFIPDDCIVGAKAIVTKPFEETNCLLAGSPAKVIRKSVTWDRKRF